MFSSQSWYIGQSRQKSETEDRAIWAMTSNESAFLSCQEFCQIFAIAANTQRTKCLRHRLLMFCCLKSVVFAFSFHSPSFCVFIVVFLTYECPFDWFKIVAERICLVSKIIWPLWSRLIFSPNEDDLSHSARMTFSGNIKGSENACTFSPQFIFRAGRTDSLYLSLTLATDHSTMRRAHLIYRPLVPR